MSLFSESGTIGLVIESGLVTAVAVDRVRGDITVTKFVEAELSIDPGDEGYSEMLTDIVRQLFGDNNLPRDNVVVAFNGSDAMLREVSLPFQDENRIRKTIKFEVEEALPIPVESCVVDYYVGRTVDNKTNVLVAAVAKERISDLLEILNSCGIDPVAVELDAAALVNAAAWLRVLDTCSVIVDIGSQFTRAVVCDGQVIFWRVFRTGGEGVANVAQRLSSELKRSLLSADLAENPRTLYVSGSHRDMPEITEALSEKMGIVSMSFPAPDGEPPISSDISWGKVTASGAIALGCALKYMGFDASSINLRQEEFVYKKKLEQLTPGLITLVSLVLVCGLMWNVKLMRVERAAVEQERLIRENAATLWMEAGVSGSRPETTEEITGKLRELVSMMKTGVPKAERKVKRSILDEWRKWSKRVPEKIDVVFDEIRMNQKKITISGTTTSAAEAEDLRAALNLGGEFKFDLPTTRPTPDGRIDFTVRHKYE